MMDCRVKPGNDAEWVEREIEWRRLDSRYGG